VGRNGSRRPGRVARRTAAVLLAAGLALLVAAGVMIGAWHQTVVITNPSMAPALRSGDHLLLDTSQAGAARRGDVVLFAAPGWGLVGSPYELKRVVAVGGDRLECCDAAGRLMLNGQVLIEPYVMADDGSSTPRTFSVTVPAGRMFLLGDNRGRSSDSRDHLPVEAGTVPVGQVAGRVVAVLLPFGRAAPVRPGAGHRGLPRWQLAAGLAGAGLLSLLLAGAFRRLARRRVRP